MDKNTIRILESVGYVASVLIVTGAMLKDRVPMLAQIGAMVLCIVLIRLVAHIAKNLPAESAAAPAASETKADETKVQLY